MEVSEESVLNFIEVTNLPIDEARKYLQEANNNLEVALNNFFVQEQTPQNEDPVVDLTSSNFADDEDVREVIPREYHRLVDDDLSARNVHLSRVKRQFNSSFRDLRREIEIQEQIAIGKAPKRQCLEDIYRNPIDITSNLEFHYAKAYSHKLNKWIAVLINDESFESLSFNRDFFNEPSQRVKNILRENFVFLRKNSSDEEGMRIMQMYNISHQTVPIFLIIDSLTGELRKNIGDCTKMTLRGMIRELKKYTSTKDKGLVYNSSYEDSDPEDVLPVPTSSSVLLPSTSKSNQPQLAPAQPKTDKIHLIDSDEESFASINSNEISDDEDVGTSTEAKVLDSDDELLKSDDEPQTNILLKLNDENHKFKYPAKRTVGHLINYIYRNYLLQTKIYDNKTKRFSLFSKIHNCCLTTLDQEKSLAESDIHPSIVLMHNTNTIERE